VSDLASAALLASTVAVGDALPELAVEVTPTTVVLGALASRDWRPMHHDHKFATERNGVQDIFLNTPNQAAWIERYLTDWTGPKGRVRRMTFRMRDSVFPGDRMVFTGTVTATGTDDAGCAWAEAEITVTATPAADGPGGTAGVAKVATTCTARVALPHDEDDNPWARTGPDWTPGA
jgi:hydroxyacyl-ACP dehydratase HTD2-like protein with hotdog domain